MTGQDGSDGIAQVAAISCHLDMVGLVVPDRACWPHTMAGAGNLQLTFRALQHE